MAKDKINIKTALMSEFSTEVLSGGKRHIVETEAAGTSATITTRVYQDGRITTTRKTDFSHLKGKPNSDKKLLELMQNQHQMTVRMIQKSGEKERKGTSDYLDEVTTLLRKKKQKDALEILSEALQVYPSDPFLLSYFGCLDAVVNKNFESGIDACKTAIDGLERKIPFGHEFFYPAFYLNLGRAYLSAGLKEDAVTSFNKGYAADPENKDIIWELKKLGERRRPPVPFLSRENPINKYIGLLVHKIKS